MSAESESLKAALEGNRSADGSVKTLVTKLLGIIGSQVQAATDLAQLKLDVAASVAELTGDSQSLTDFTLANTPADTSEAVARRAARRK